MDWYKSIKQGLNEAIAFEKGESPDTKVDRISIAILPTFSPEKIKDIRARHRMTQKLFAEAVGVSVKTVEAWESGKNPPSGCANRLLELLDRDEHLFEKYSILVHQ